MTIPSEKPIFQTILGTNWDRLGPVIREHYFLRPFSDDAITVRGVMGAVDHSAIAKFLIPLGRLFGALVPYRGTDVPIEVHYTSRRDSGELHWDRIFRLPGRRPFHFRSFMVAAGGNRVIEFVRFGVGLRLRVTAEDGALIFRDDGYVWRLLGIDVPLPLWLLLGRAYIEERPVNAESFSMRMSFRHPLLGEMFRYDGRFAL